MGVRTERNELLNYLRVLKNLKFNCDANQFRIDGNINKWEDIEIISRSYYRELEELLYSKEINDLIHMEAVKRILKKNNMLDKSLLEILYEKKFSFQSMKVFLMKLDDYVYYSIKKDLPYIKQLSLITYAINELLENTLKYTMGDFRITTAILNSDQKYPLNIKVENRYKQKDKLVLKNFERLQNNIKDVNSIEEASTALVNILKKRSMIEVENEYSQSSQLGFAKIRVETGAIFDFTSSSEIYGDSGITINLKIPLAILPREEIQEKVNQIFLTMK